MTIPSVNTNANLFYFSKFQAMTDHVIEKISIKPK